MNARICTKAAVDPKFGEQLKADPRATFDRELGSKIPVPDGFEITVLEEAPAHWYVVLARDGTRWPSAWTERDEDGRIDYAIAGLGLGLLAGSLLSIAGDNTGSFAWHDLPKAPISALGVLFGLVLFLITLIPQSRSDRDWSWKPHPRAIQRYLATKAGKDPSFREELKAHPRRAFDRERGSRVLMLDPVPDGFEITVLEETPTHEYIVL